MPKIGEYEVDTTDGHDDVIRALEAATEMVALLRARVAALEEENRQLRIGYDGDLIDWLEERVAAESAALEEVARLRVEVSSCSAVIKEMQEQVARLRGGLASVRDIGHNDNCLFCGFKDRRIREALEGDNAKP